MSDWSALMFPQKATLDSMRTGYTLIRIPSTSLTSVSIFSVCCSRYVSLWVLWGIKGVLEFVFKASNTNVPGIAFVSFCRRKTETETNVAEPDHFHAGRVLSPCQKETQQKVRLRSSRGWIKPNCFIAKQS